MRHISYCLSLLAACTTLNAFAADSVIASPSPDSLHYAFMHGTPNLDVRYRYEFVDQEGIAKEANASTLRTRLGYVTGAFHGFKAGLELENVTRIGNDRFNDTVNGKTAYATVADPDDTSVNQAFLRYEGLEKTNITLGRQAINLDNQRFVATAEWRQNNQTFDAFSIHSTYINHASLYYAYVDRVNRVFGTNSPASHFRSDSHLINGSYEFAPQLKATAYAYLLDFENSPTFSSATYGTRLTGKHAASDTVTLSYALEGAHQLDYGKNTTNTSENYYLIEPAISAYGFTGKIGYEVLQGNGVTAFQTPLASYHLFNGWADKFLTTPANGLEDIYGSLSYKIPTGNEYIKGTEFTVAYHDYDSDRGSISYGSEWNAMVSQTFAKRYTVAMQFADYQADQFGTDTTKVTAWLQIKY